MKNPILTSAEPYEYYVVEIDERIISVHQAYTEALKAGLELKRAHPHDDVKVRDANEQMPANVQSAA